MMSAKDSIVHALRGLMIAGFVAVSSTSQAAENPPVQWGEQQQLVTVVSAGWDAATGTLRRYERSGGAWQPVGKPVIVNLGKRGSAWGLGLHPPQSGTQKREGDGRAPAGLFAIGTAFGSAKAITTGLSYQPMKASHVCVDVPASPLYNQIVDTREVGEAAVAGNTEPMRRDLLKRPDDLYRMGFVIAHNEQGIANAGSCIFAHVWRRKNAPTAGCTSMDPSALEAVLEWLEEGRSPRFVLLPQDQYGDLAGTWDLPDLP